MSIPICEICKKNPVSYVVNYKLRNENNPREFKICSNCFEENQKDKEYLYKIIEGNIKRK